MHVFLTSKCMFIGLLSPCFPFYTTLPSLNASGAKTLLRCLLPTAFIANRSDAWNMACEQENSVELVADLDLASWDAKRSFIYRGLDFP